MELPRHYGQVIVSDQFIGIDPERVSEIFAKLKAVVVRCEHNWAGGDFQYTIFSPFFRLLDVGEIVPAYEIMVTVHYDENGVVDSFAVEPKERPGSHYWSMEHRTLDLLFKKPTSEGETP